MTLARRSAWAVLAACMLDGGAGGADPARSQPGAVQPAALAHHRPRGQSLLAPRPASPAIPSPTTSAPRRAASGRPPMAAPTGRRSSTRSRCSRSARSPSPSPIRTSCGPAPAKARSAATSRVGPGRLQVARRRQDLDADGPRADRPHPARWSSIRQNPDIVLVCALGHAYGPQPERGVFRTTDGGETWTQDALRRREHRLLRHRDGSEEPARALRRACGQLEIHTWGRDSGGPGSGLFTSRDGGVDLDAAAGPRPADASRSARWRWRSRASNPQPRLRAHRDRRRRAVEGPADRARAAVALGGRRRHLAGGELRPQRHGPRALLLAHGRRARRRRRGVLPDRVVLEVDRRRPHASRVLQPRPGQAPGRRPPRHLDRSRPTPTGRSSPTTRGCRSPSIAARRGTASG